MGFLIRSIFWLSLVLLIIPFDGNGEGEEVGPLQALNAAREAVGDLSGFCERKPEVCETGRAAFQTIGARAREGAKIAYEMLDEQFGEPDTAIVTGGTQAHAAKTAPVPPAEIANPNARTATN